MLQRIEYQPQWHEWSPVIHLMYMPGAFPREYAKYRPQMHCAQSLTVETTAVCICCHIIACPWVGRMLAVFTSGNDPS